MKSLTALRLQDRIQQRDEMVQIANRASLAGRNTVAYFAAKDAKMLTQQCRTIAAWLLNTSNNVIID